MLKLPENYAKIIYFFLLFSIIMRRIFFIIGLISRTLAIMLFILYTTQSTLRFNDMSESIYLGLQNMLKGVNPYSQIYQLNWGNTTFSQPLNYGPITLLLYLPAMILPNWIGSCWLGMAIMINFYNYLMCESLSMLISKDKAFQENAKLNEIRNDKNVNRFIYYAGGFLWMIPFGSMPETVFIFLPAWLMIMGYYYRNKPILSGLFVSLACMSYQLAFLFLPMFIAYYLKSPQILKSLKQNLKKVGNFVLGSIPTIVVSLVFLFWGNPMSFIFSLFLYTGTMGYVKAPGANVSLDGVSWSIPKWLYDLSNGAIQIGNQARLVMFVILGILLIMYLFNVKFHNDVKFQNYYSILAVALFILTTNYGGIHYFIFAILPIIVIIQYYYPDFHKKVKD